MKRNLALLAAAVLAALALELGLLQWMKPHENRLLDAFVKRKRQVSHRIPTWCWSASTRGA